jgi:hypothetical protein
LGETGQKSGTTLRRLGRAAAAGFRRGFVAWIAIVALVVQLGSAAVPQAMAGAGDAESVAALGALKALLGPNAALCQRGDASAPGSPSHNSHHCCDDCALCQLDGHTAALAPSSAAILPPFANNAGPLGIRRDTGFSRLQRVAFAQPRAPPISL